MKRIVLLPPYNSSCSTAAKSRNGMLYNISILHVNCVFQIICIIFMQEKCFESVESATDSGGVSVWISVNDQATLQHSPNSHG